MKRIQFDKNASRTWNTQLSSMQVTLTLIIQFLFLFQIYIMLCLNFDFYIIPLTLLLTFLKQYVMCMLLAERNVNPEEQVRI